MRHTDGHFTTPDGSHIYTQAWLPDNTPQAIIVIVHGLGEHSGRYGNYVDYFVPRGYALYSFDTRGHVRSRGTRGWRSCSPARAGGCSSTCATVAGSPTPWTR